MRCAPGTGVVISAGEYRRFTEKIFAFAGALKRLGLSSRMPRPLLAVHSGRTTMTESGFSRISVESEMSRAFGGGDI